MRSESAYKIFCFNFFNIGNSVKPITAKTAPGNYIKVTIIGIYGIKFRVMF